MSCCGGARMEVCRKSSRTLLPLLLLVVCVFVSSICLTLISKYGTFKMMPASDFYAQGRCADNTTFDRAFYFVTTVVFSIGYGDMAPCSWAGKLVTCVTAMIGVPVTLLCLGRIGICMAATIDRIDSAIRSKKVTSEDDDLKIKLVVGVLVNIIWTLLSAVYFWQTMKQSYELHEPDASWSYFDAYYFTIITLFTIGLGDYYPMSGEPFSLSIFLFVGLSLVSMVVALIRQSMESQFDRVISVIQDVYTNQNWKNSGRQLQLNTEEQQVANVVLELWKNDPSGSWLKPLLRKQSSVAMQLASVGGRSGEGHDLTPHNLANVTSAGRKWKRKALQKNTSCQTVLWPLLSETCTQTSSSAGKASSSSIASVTTVSTRVSSDSELEKGSKKSSKPRLPAIKATVSPVKIKVLPGKPRLEPQNRTHYRDFHF